jgi:aminoethylphosphonate catabolism LysR family transcriptional regulator
MMHVSQPTITTQVKFLEEGYGVELFQRAGRKVVLTPIGEQLFALCQRIFSLETDAIHLLQDAGELKTGFLRVGAVGPFHVTEMLASFNQVFPEVRVKVSVGNSESVMQKLVSYESDVAVLAQFSQDERFYSLPYSRHPIVLFAHKGHPFCKSQAVQLEELEGQPMIFREEGSTTRKALEGALRRKGVSPKVLMEVGSREAIREAVIKGVGIGCVSEVEYIPHRSLCMIRIRNAEVFTDAHVVCLKDRKDARLISAFLGIARDLKRNDFKPRRRV